MAAVLTVAFAVGMTSAYAWDNGRFGGGRNYSGYYGQGYRNGGFAERDHGRGGWGGYEQKRREHDRDYRDHDRDRGAYYGGGWGRGERRGGLGFFFGLF